MRWDVPINVRNAFENVDITTCHAWQEWMGYNLRFIIHIWRTTFYRGVGSVPLQISAFLGHFVPSLSIIVVIDTGSSVSIIDGRFLRQQNLRVQATECNQGLYGFGESFVNVQRYMVVPITFEQEVTHNVAVFEMNQEHS